MLTYQLNKELDKEMALAFLPHVQGGVDFGKTIWIDHPLLKDIEHQNKKYISDYFDHFYTDHFTQLDNTVRMFQKNWNLVEQDFFQQCNNLFNKYEFPKGKYIGYISTFNCNPRFLEDKTFQVYYLAKRNIQTTAHELLHFIFYSYTQNQFPELTKTLDPNTGVYWQVAEIFNTTILNTEPFKHLLGSGEEGYPQQRQLVIKSTEIYNKTQTIDKLIKELFSLVKSSNS